MILSWDNIANIEQSLFDFLKSAIQTGNIQVLDDNGTAKDVNVRVGNKFDKEWSLPTIQIFHDSNPSAPRESVGSERRDTRYLIIIDIRANNETNRLNIADWVTDTINDGFPFYEYTMNGNSPTKILKGECPFDFVTNTKVNLGLDADLIDKYRHRISISCWISRNV